MRPYLVGMGVLVLTVGVSAEEQKTNKEKLQGTWQVVRHEAEGEELPKELSQASRWTFTADRYIGKSPEREYRGSFTLDPAKKVKEIDLQPDDGDRKPLQGIYKMDGDELTICFALQGQARPTEFVTKPDSGHVMYVTKRLKK